MNALTTFQAQAQVARAGRKKFPYGPELRRLAVEHARQVVARGGTLGSAADALGVNINSLRAWRDAAQGAMVPVMVTDAVASTITVHGPAGLRIEGLSLSDLAELLRLLA